MYIQATLKGLSRLYCTYCQVQRKLPLPQIQQEEGKMAVVLLSMRKLMLAFRLPESQVPLIHFKLLDSHSSLLYPKLPQCRGFLPPPAPHSYIPATSAKLSLSTLPLTAPLPLSLFLCLWPCSVYYFLCSRLFQKSLWLFSLLCRVKPSP